MELLDVADGLCRIQRGDDLVERGPCVVAPAAEAAEPRESDDGGQDGRWFGGLTGRLDGELEICSGSGQLTARLENGRAYEERQVLLAREAGRPDQRVRLSERLLPVARVEPEADDVAPEERRALNVTVLLRARRALDRHLDRPSQVADGGPGNAEVGKCACGDTAVADELERPIEQLDGASVAILRHARGLRHHRVRLEPDVADRSCVLGRPFRLAAPGVELEVHHEHPRVFGEDERRRARRRPSVEDGRCAVEQPAGLGRARMPRVPTGVDGRLGCPLRVPRARERVDRPLEEVTGAPGVGQRPSRVEEQLGRRLGVPGEQRQCRFEKRRGCVVGAERERPLPGVLQGPHGPRTQSDDVLAGRTPKLDRSEVVVREGLGPVLGAVVRERLDPLRRREVPFGTLGARQLVVRRVADERGRAPPRDRRSRGRLRGASARRRGSRRPALRTEGERPCSSRRPRPSPHRPPRRRRARRAPHPCSPRSERGDPARAAPRSARRPRHARRAPHARPARDRPRARRARRRPRRPRRR